MGAVEGPLSTLLVVTHGAADPAAATAALVAETARQLRARVARDERVLVVASGGKRHWRDEFSQGEDLLREITRDVGIEAFSPAAAAVPASVEVEGRSRDISESARNCASLIGRRLDRVASVTVVTVDDAARAEARRLFADALPGVAVDVAAAADADAPAPKRRRGA